MRKLRYRQVLRYRTRGIGKNIYKGQVRLQQSFYLEDNVSTPSISKVRELHTEIGTWDKETIWCAMNCHNEEGRWRDNVLWVGNLPIYPKSNFYKIQLQAKLKRWKEQERHVEEFFESMGV